MSALLDALRIAEQRLRRLALILAIGSPATAASSYALLALEPKVAVSAMLALLLAVLAQRGARRSRVAWVVTGALHLLLAVLIAQQGINVPNPLLPVGIAVHALFGLVAVLGLRALSRLDAAEVDAARPIPLSAVNMPGPSVPLPFPPTPVPKLVMPTLPSLPATPTVPIDGPVRAADTLGEILGKIAPDEPSTELSTGRSTAAEAATDAATDAAVESVDPAATSVTMTEPPTVEPASASALPPLAPDLEDVDLAPHTRDLDIVAESPSAAVEPDPDESEPPEPVAMSSEPAAASTKTAAAKMPVVEAIGSPEPDAVLHDEQTPREARPEALPEPVAETAPAAVAAVPTPEPAAKAATDVATLLAADIPPMPVSAPVVKTAPPVSAFSPTVTKAARPEPPPVPKAETRPDVPSAIPPPQAVLHIAKEVDALGRIQCPRCRYRQVDTPFCVYCSFDLDKYWAAAQRARELEARLGHSPPAN
ncbi:MAG: hypothetical protein A4S14_13310 [Proteobacteria bacterium SG_bin9]|nr:MAG: hypothetical protein A4S14_13310 [Proteobacteria bacterium SG_bin9]